MNPGAIIDPKTHYGGANSFSGIFGGDGTLWAPGFSKWGKQGKGETLDGQ